VILVRCYAAKGLKAIGRKKLGERLQNPEVRIQKEKDGDRCAALTGL